MHAGWNILAKIGREPRLTPAVMMATAAIAGLVALPFVPVPAAASWPYLAVSTLLHVGYFAFLFLSYRFGDLSQVYPIARGISPLGVTAISALVAGEVLAAAELAGVVVISLGILGLAFSNGRPARQDMAPLVLAFGTGVFIVAYTVVDGLGVRLSGSPLGYIAWLFVLWGLPGGVAPLILRRRDWPAMEARDWAAAAAGGGLTVAAYGIVLWAFTLGAMAPVVALRETSVVFAALIGTLFLGESAGLRRVAAAVAVAGGVVLLNLNLPT